MSPFPNFLNPKIKPETWNSVQLSHKCPSKLNSWTKGRLHNQKDNTDSLVDNLESQIVSPGNQICSLDNQTDNLETQTGILDAR